MILRQLEQTDFEKGYFDLLSQLAKIGDVSQMQFTKKYTEINKIYPYIQIWVIEFEDKVIASGTILIEPKFIHSCSNVAHIEDIVVHRDFRNLGYARIIIEKLLNLAKDHNCYKVILDCKEDIKDFYSKFEFESKNIQMSKYFFD